MEYEGAEALWDAVALRVGRIPTGDERNLVDPDGTFGRSQAVYDVHDVDDLAGRIRQLPKRTRPTRATRRRLDLYRNADLRVSEIADDAAALRARLFDGQTTAPFSTAAEAGTWIEGNQSDTPLVRHGVSVFVPTGEGIEGYYAIRDVLSEVLPADMPHDRTSARLVRGELIAPGRLAAEIMEPVVLPYVAASGGRLIMRFAAFDDSSPLAALHAEATQLAERMRWPLENVVLYILTGLIWAPSVVPRVEASPGREYVTLNIPYPLAVDAEQVARAYRVAVEGLRTVPRQHRSRQQPTRRAEAVEIVRFVDRTPGLTWPQRRKLWNSEHPDSGVVTSDALRKRFERAKQRV